MKSAYDTKGGKMDNYTGFLNKDLSADAGKWVVMVNGSVVEKGTNVKELLDKAKERYPREERLLVKIPKRETLIL